jgi:putative phosphoesterase
LHILVIGDFHIPDRAFVVPGEVDASITRATQKHDYDLVACTGDLTKAELLEPVLASWSPETMIVQGNMDYDLRNAKGFPRKSVFDTTRFLPGNEVLKIGITHGHQVAQRGDPARLTEIAEQMGINVLISGHTHIPSIVLHRRIDDGKQVLLLNPGSATGAWSFVATLVPSFIVLDIDASKNGLNLTVTLYEFRDGKEEKRVQQHMFKGATFI